MSKTHCCVIACAAAILCSIAHGDDSVVLGGIVVDQNGGVVLSAKLTLTNKATAAELKTKPDTEGKFSFASVPAGAYTLKVKAESFETVEREIKVGASAPKPLRIRMELKAHDEEVTVTSERGPGLELDAGENASSMRIEENMLMAVPVDGTDVLGTLTNFLSPASQGAMGPSVVVDGMEESAFDIPAWSIKRIRINKNPYSAQFRRPGNARVEVATRDGRSNFHGGISLFAHDSTLDARNPLAATKPDTGKRLLEARITGPIRGHPFWYFFNFDRLSDQRSAIVNAFTLSGPVNRNIRTPAEQTNFLGRIDFRPNQMHSMSLRYAVVDTSQRNRGVGEFHLPETGYSAGQRESNVQFSDHRISTANFNNDFRIQFAREEDREGSLPAQPSLVVKGAFTGGPSQNFDSEHEKTVRVQNLTNYYKGRHRLQFGGQIRPRWVNARQQSDFAGVFEFANIERFAAGRPYVFRFNQGDPLLNFTQHEAFDFIQDQVLIGRNVQILTGLRHEWHGSLAKANHVAPRIGLAWSPGERKTMVFRAGAGIFYESVPKSIIRRSLLFDGERMREFVIPSPSFPDPFTGGTLVLTPPSVVRTAPDLTLPYLAQASAGVERALTQKVQLSVEYRALRALHIYRSRDVNAPLPGTLIRPAGDFLKITEVESTGNMRTNAVDFRVRWNGKRFAGMAQYTLSYTNDDAYSLFASPANNYDLRPEWGRADYDRRHQLSLMGSTTLPGKIRVGTVTTIGSGLPFNITTGEDNNGDTVAADRPAGVTRNTGNGGGLVQINLRFTKLFEARRLYKKHKKDFTNLELSVDMFNILNHTNFERFVGVLNSPFFGTANAAMAGRTVQTSVRYSW